jgi:hypothetical protein
MVGIDIPAFPEIDAGGTRQILRVFPFSIYSTHYCLLWKKNGIRSSPLMAAKKGLLRRWYAKSPWRRKMGISGISSG